MQLDSFLVVVQERVEAYLKEQLAIYSPLESGLAEAMQYAVLGSGKRVRPLLAYGAAKSLSKDLDLSVVDAAAAAVELIHCYSLVHDDLPALDNDALRRGQPTCHIAFGEATAVLVGDALQGMAYEVLSNSTYPDAIKVKMVCTLAQAAGSRGMVDGQAIDLSVVAQKPSVATLEQMHQLKTGALIRASVQLGAFAGGCLETQEMQHLVRYGEAIGLAFQVRDDILDVVADTQALGKQQGADAARDKPTYVSLLGLEGAREKLGALNQIALAALDHLPGDTEILAAIADYVINRDH